MQLALMGIKGVIGVPVEEAPEIFLFHELNVLASILDVDIELQFG